jgi:RNA polymerase sigma factor (sigma-70 family)
MSFGSFYLAETDSNRPKHFARLLNLLRRKGRSREDAEDLIQEAMLRLHVYAKSEVVVNEEAFLRRAMHNLAVNHYRRNRSVAGREVQIEDADRQHPLIAPEPTPDRVLESQQCLDQLTAILDALSRRTREVYLAHRFGYSYAEIAADMGIAKITIKGVLLARIWSSQSTSMRNSRNIDLNPESLGWTRHHSPAERAE